MRYHAETAMLFKSPHAIPLKLAHTWACPCCCACRAAFQQQRATSVLLINLVGVMERMDEQVGGRVGGVQYVEVRRAWMNRWVGELLMYVRAAL